MGSVWMRASARAPMVGASLAATAAGAAAILTLGLLGGASAYAQVETDGSVGRRVQLGGPEFEIRADLGRQEGRNLFHSFERFSLDTGERATFTAPDEARIGRVISRVTGGERSDIDGTIRSTIAGADFYFLNPAGVMFGPNASLDVKGSFHVSTADELRFADSAVFSADRNAASSFTVARPEAFGFLGSSPAPILVNQSVLEVPAGKSFSIVGGDIDIAGGPEGFIAAEAGQITLAAVGAPGEAQLGTGAIDAIRKADILLTDLAVVDTSGNGGGMIRIRGSEFVVENQSLLVADNHGALDAVGGIDVDADRVWVTDGSLLGTGVLGSGQGGDLRVSAAEVHLVRGGLLASLASEESTGNAGRVQVTAGSVEILEDSDIASGTLASGQGGDIRVETGRLTVDGGDDGQSAISSSTESKADAGTVTVRADEIEIRKNGEIRSLTFGDGNAGTVTVAASGFLRIDGHGSEFTTGIASAARALETEDGQVIIPRGDAGRLIVRAEELEILNGGEIDTATSGEGSAGSITVEAERLKL